MTLIPLIWDLTLRFRALPACLLPHTVCLFSQLEPLNSHVLILRHARRKEHRPFIGSVRRNVMGDFVVGSRAEPLLSFPAPVLHPFLDSLLDALFPLGLGHFDFPCSVSCWRWAGKFTSQIWESTWLPSVHLWPYAHSGVFGLPTLISFCCLLLRLEVCLFCASKSSVLGLAFPGLTSNTQGYLLLCFSNIDYLFSWTMLLLFLWLLPVLSLSWFQYVFPDPTTPGSNSLMLWDFVLGLFPLWMIAFLVRSCNLSGRV